MGALLYVFADHSPSIIVNSSCSDDIDKGVDLSEWAVTTRCDSSRYNSSTIPSEYRFPDAMYATSATTGCPSVSFGFLFRDVVVGDTITAKASVSATSTSVVLPTSRYVVMTMALPVGNTTLTFTFANTMSPLTETVLTDYTYFNCLKATSPPIIETTGLTAMFDPIALNSGVLPVVIQHSTTPPPYTCATNNTGYTCTLDSLPSSNSNFLIRLKLVRSTASSVNYSRKTNITITDIYSKSSSIVITPFVSNSSSQTIPGSIYDCSLDFLFDVCSFIYQAKLTNTAGSTHVYYFNGAPLPFRPISGTPTSGTWLAYYPFVGDGSMEIDRYGSTLKSYVDSSKSIAPMKYKAWTGTAIKPLQLNNVPMWTFTDTSVGEFAKFLIMDETYGGLTSQYSVPYPYGLGKGPLKSLTYTIAKIISPLKSARINLSISYGTNQGPFTVDPISPTTVDNTPPKLLDITYTHFGSYSLIVRVHASDDLSGVYRIVIGKAPYHIDIRQHDLVYGTKFDGYFEVQYNYTELLVQSNTITISDEAENTATFTPTSLLGTTLASALIPIPPSPYTYYPSNITNFEFTQNNVDVSSKIVQNELHFNVVNADKAFRPRMQLFSDNIDREMFAQRYTFEGYYSEELGQYVIPFTMAANTFTGPIEYKIFMHPFNWDPRIVASMVGSKAFLNVTCSNADQSPPFITSIVRTTSSSVDVAKNVQPTFGWIVKVTDATNGFKYGIFEAKSSLDGLTYAAHFDQTNMTSNGEYKISFTLDANCADQKFTFNITLVDTMGFRTSMSSLIVPNVFNTITQPPTSYQVPITVSCSANSEVVIPTIGAFDFQPREINTALGQANRTVAFSLTVADAGSGLSLRHNPTIFLTSMGDEILNISAILTTFSGANATYNFNFTLPYGFGVGGSLVSIYGITDLQLNHLGLSASDLSALTLPFFLNTTFAPLAPILETYSPITDVGGPLTVYGHSFGIDKTKLEAWIYYYDGAGYVTIPTVFFSGTILTFSTAGLPNGAILRVAVNGITSNDLHINSEKPYVEPTLPPLSCPGNPICSGHGRCTEEGCECEAEWSSADCSLNIDTGKIPVTNDTFPTTIFGKSRISVIAVRELDANETIIHNFPLRNWQPSNSSTEDRVTYKYTTLLEERETAITVQIDWFPDPNFSLLIDPGNDGDSGGVCSSKDKGLSKTALIAIILACSLFALAIAVGVGYVMVRKHQKKALKIQMNRSLSSMSTVNH
eukprot:gene1083-1228_t